MEDVCRTTNFCCMLWKHPSVVVLVIFLFAASTTAATVLIDFTFALLMRLFSFELELC